MKDEIKKTRYSDSELEEFKSIIEQKIAMAQAEYDTLAKSLNSSNILYI